MVSKKQEITEAFARAVIKVNLAFRQYMQARFKEHNIDLTFEMLQVLGALWQKDGVNQQELADLTIKDKASMTYLIDNISRRGLVYRQEDSSDRRNKLIYLTPDGQALKLRIRPWIEEMYKIAGRDLSMDQLRESINMLEEIRSKVSGAS